MAAWAGPTCLAQRKAATSFTCLEGFLCQGHLGGSSTPLRLQSGWPQVHTQLWAPSPSTPYDLWIFGVMSSSCQAQKHRGASDQEWMQSPPLPTIPLGPWQRREFLEPWEPREGAEQQGEPDPHPPAPRLCWLWPPGASDPRGSQRPSASLRPFPTLAHPLREEAWPGLEAGLGWGPRFLESAEAAEEEDTEGRRRQAG